MRKFLGTLFLGAALLAPLSVQAQNRRYYDRENRIYHTWNRNENRAYWRFLDERKESRREFARETRERQRDYWRWRRNHSDAILFPR